MVTTSCGLNTKNLNMKHLLLSLWHGLTVRVLIVCLALMIFCYGMFFPQGTFDAVKKAL